MWNVAKPTKNSPSRRKLAGARRSVSQIRAKGTKDSSQCKPICLTRASKANSRKGSQARVVSAGMDKELT